MSDDPSRAYFAHVRLGDFSAAAPERVTAITPIQLRGGVSATRKGGLAYGASTHDEVNITATILRGDAESLYDFRARVRQFHEDIKAAQASTIAGTNGPSSWLVFVLDPNGTQGGVADEVTATASWLSGSQQVSHDGDTTGWAIGDKVLVLDATNPSTVSEIVTLTDVQSSDIEATFANAHADASTLLRIEWYVAEAWFIDSIRTQPPKAGQRMVSIPLTLQFVVDPTEGRA